MKNQRHQILIKTISTLMQLSCGPNIPLSACSSQRRSRKWSLVCGRGYETTGADTSSPACHQNAANDRSWGMLPAQLTKINIMQWLKA